MRIWDVRIWEDFILKVTLLQRETLESWFLNPFIYTKNTKFSLTRFCKSFQKYLPVNESFYFKHYNLIFDWHYKSEMKIGFLNSFKTTCRTRSALF